MRKITQRLLLLVLMMVPMLAMSQVMVEQFALETGTDSTKWVTLSTDPTITSTLLTETAGDAKASEVANIGFDFVFGGVTYTQFSVNTDGNLRLGPVATEIGGYSTPFGDYNLSKSLPKINAFGCDGKMTTGGYVKYAVTGTMPNRVLVVEYKTAKYAWSAETSDIAFQVQLFETSNEIQFVYSSVAPTTVPTTFQIGMASSETDVITVNTTTGLIECGMSEDKSSSWPVVNTYYRFYAPTCIKPGALSLTAATSTSADFSFTPAAGQATWEYVCVLATDTPDWNNATSIGESTFTVSDLTPNTEYNVYLRTNCGADGFSDPINYTFRTECVTLSTPYIEGFETYSAHNIPQCWQSLLGESEVVENGYYSTYAHTGENALEIVSLDVVVAPRVKLAANEMMLVANIMASRANAGNLEIGYVTNPALMDFTSVSTINPAHDSYEEYVIDFSSLTITDTVYLAFRYNVETYSSYYIDDITIAKASTCPRPTYAFVRDVTHNSAVVEWSANDNVMSYEIAYGFTDTLENATRQNVEVGENTWTLSDLISDTTYYVWVHNICDVDSSMWRFAGSFTTKSSCAKVVNAQVSSVGYSSAAISWAVDASYGELATAVELTYKKAGDAVWSAPIQFTDQSYYILQNLDNGASYQVRLRTRCDQDSAEAVLLTFMTIGCEQEVSTGASNTYYVPFAGNYNYSYSQMLYPDTCLTGLTTINGISFNVLTRPTDARVVDVYVANVSQESVMPETMIPIASMTKVATGVTVPINTGWVNVPFDTPFTYDGTSKLAIAIDDNTGSYGETIKVSTQLRGSSVYKRTDSDNINPADTALTNVHLYDGTPDIKFFVPCDNIPSCLAPIVAFSDITANSVSLTWNPGATETQWLVEYKVADSTVWNSETVSVQSHTISELSSGTNYDLRVGALCGTDTVFATLQFTTDCDVYDVPFVENFDNGSLECWYGGGLSGNMLDVEWLADEQLLEFGSDGGYLITPSLAPELNTLQVAFSVASVSLWNSSVVVISAGSDPENYNSFIPIDTVLVPEDSPMTPQIVSLANYAGTGHYVMISTSVGEIFLDNVRIETIPECSLPSDLTISNVTSDGAVLTWVDEGSMVEKWLVSYVEYGSSTPVVAEVLADEGSTYTFTGLNPNTNYTATVATVCFNNDTNSALHPVDFLTECADVTLPYTEDFEGLARNTFHQCWYRSETSVVSNYDLPYYYITVPSVYVGERSDNTVIISDNTEIISPRIPIPANQIALNFDMRVQDTAYSGELVIGFSTASDSDNNMIVIDTLDIDTTNWNNYTINFNGLTSTDTGYVVFKNINSETFYFDYEDNNYMIWLDNINFSTYTSCVRPFNTEVSNITATSATISFSDTANAGDYTIAWNTTNDVNSAFTVDATTTTSTLSNLQPSTTYYVWVRSNCSDAEHSAWTIVKKFKTECTALTIPYVENFDDYTYGIGADDDLPVEYPNHTLPNCWTIIGNSTLGVPLSMISNYPFFATSGTNVLFAESASDEGLYMVLPRFTAPIDSLMLTFKYKNDEASGNLNEFVLGVMSDPNDTSTFILLSDIPTAADTTSVEHVFALDTQLVANTNYNIAFRFGGIGSFSQYLGIDDVKVVYAPNCYKPVDLSVLSISSNSVNVEWNGNAANYKVQYRPVATSDWTTVSVATNNVTLTNLTGNTEYEMQVRGICSATDSSALSDVFNFRTPCAATTLPWSENFESYTIDVSDNYSRPATYPNHAMPECWVYAPMTNSDYGGPALWLTSNTNSSYISYNVIEGTSLRFYSNSDKPTYAIMPLMDAPIDSIAISFEYAMANNAAPLELGVVTNPYDFSTYTQVATFPNSESAHGGEHYFITDNLDANQTYYIVFNAGFSNGYTTVLDNIVVDYLPSCIRPTGVAASEIASNSAKIKWLTTSTSSEITYRGEGETEWTNVIANADSVVLTNLNSSSVYQLAVRSICSATDTSVWSDTISFITSCAPYALPYSEDFENIQDLNEVLCWNYYDGLYSDVLAGIQTLEEVEADEFGNWRFEDQANEVLSTPHIYLNIYGTNSCAAWAFSPVLSITPNASLSFDIAFSNYYGDEAASNFDDDRVYVLATTDNGATWTKLITWGPDSTDTYPLDSLTMAGDSIAVSLNDFVGQDIRIIFYGESTVSGGDNNVHIDNILVQGDACGIPTDVVVTPDPVSAVFTWSGSSQDYEISIRESGVTTWTDSIAVSGFTYTFTDLTPATAYEYRLRQVCAEGVASTWITGAFTTLELPCGVPVLTVSDVTGDGATFTWTSGENNTSWEVNIFNAMMNESYDVTEATYVANDLAAATEYNVAVRAKCAENVYSDWSDTITFTTLDCLPVTNVTASQITANSAVITWTAGANETQWIVNYGDRDFAQGQGSFDTVATTTYTITGLESESYYDVYVRAMCGDDFNSTWSDPVCQFQTLVGGSEGIDGIDGNFQFAIYPNPTSGSTTISLNGVEGKVTISVVDMNGRIVTNEAMECGSDCEKRVDLSGLAQGTYFVRVLGDDINSVRKLIVR